jgi:hypothetical protein
MSDGSNETAPADKDAQDARLDELLDQALSFTFPASDPISLNAASRAIGGPAKQAGSDGRRAARTRSGYSRNDGDG